MSLKIDRVQLEIIINSDPARQQLAKLDQQAAELRKQLRKLPEGTAEYIAKSKELKEVVAQHDKIIEKMGLTSLTMKELQRRATELKNILRNLDPNTEQFKELDTQLKAVSTRMNELRGINTHTGISIGKIAEGINRYIGLITVAAASLTGMVMGVRKTIDAYTEWDDKLADVMKTTGLTKDEVKGLNSEISKINTRTSQMELLDLARVAGKLGISAQDEVAGFVRATNQIKVALTEDLGGDVEESINQLGKLTEIFKLKDEFGIERALLKVGSAINSLGAASTANEAYLVEFTKRVAGVAPQADISIQKVLGLAATLDQLGQTSEVSSTVFAAVIPDMFKDTSKYAEIAGMSVNQFSRLLSVDANAAFIAFLKGLNGNNSGLGEMAEKLDGLGLEGKRSISVLGVLAANTDLLTQTQRLANTEFAKGTSLTQEYLVKNNTAQAELEKARKEFQKMAVELGEKLAPAMTFSTSGLSYFLKALKLTIEFVAENKRAIGTLVIALIAYHATVQALILIEANRNKLNIISIALTKAKTLAENAGIIVTQAYAAATMYLSGNIKGATQAVRILNTAIKGSPWGWLAAAIGAAVAYLVIFKEKSDEASKFTEYYNQSLERNTELLVAEQTEFKGLIRQAMSANEGTKLRKDLIDELNTKYPGFLRHLDAERVSNGDLARMLDNVNAMYRQKFKLVKETARIDALTKQLTDKELEKMKVEDELAKLRRMALTDGSDEAKREKELQAKLTQLNMEQKLIEGNIELVQNKANQTKQDIDNILNPSIAELEKKIAQYDKTWKIFHERADKAAKEGRPEDQKYYLDQAGNVAIEKVDAENKLTSKKKEAEEERKKRITTNNNVVVDDGKVTPESKKAMLEAKKAEQKAWADLEKQLDKELDDADKGGTGADATFLKNKESQSETDKLYDEQLNLANRLRDLNREQTQEQYDEEQKRIEFKRKAMEIKQQLEEQSLQAASQSLGNIAALFNENTAAYKITASLKAAVDTYMAANVALASAPPPFNYILMATTIAAGLANVAKINAIQFAEGRYPVTGASDGRTYNAAYQSTPRTGLYTKPTLVGGLGLVGERGSEIVISHPHVRHLQMNYPEVIRTIYNTSGRVPQYAQGNYPAATRTPGAGAAPANEAQSKEDMMIALMSEMVSQLKRPTRAFVTYNDLNDTVNEVSTVENSLK